MGGQGAAQEPTEIAGGEGKEVGGLLGRHKAAQEPTEGRKVGSLPDMMRERAREGKKKEEEEKLDKREKVPVKRSGRKKEAEPSIEGSPM